MEFEHHFNCNTYLENRDFSAINLPLLMYFDMLIAVNEKMIQVPKSFIFHSNSLNCTFLCTLQTASYHI